MKALRNALLITAQWIFIWVAPPALIKLQALALVIYLCLRPSKSVVTSPKVKGKRARV